MKLIISRQLTDSPPPQQGASDPISRLTGTPHYPVINIISQKTNRNSPLSPVNQVSKSVSRVASWSITQNFIPDL